MQSIEEKGYLSGYHFVATLLAALFLHLIGGAIYYLAPTQQIEEIPVRVLNVKLGGDVNAAAITSASFATAALAAATFSSPSIPTIRAPL